MINNRLSPHLTPQEDKRSFVQRSQAKKVEILAVPTYIITGFLGVGKTSTILQLLNHKPASGRWAILVNEFGEIGVDGSLLEQQYSEQQGVFVREVPGGCMCCTAGLPMQVALNQLLVHARPDCLLIEPTGLGHPKEIVETLSTGHYKEVLALQKVLTLVDARHLSDSRYTDHEIFNQQIEIADIIIGNKVDLYQNEDKDRLITYLKQRAKPNIPIEFASHGEITLSLLDGKSTNANDDRIWQDLPMLMPQTDHKHSVKNQHNHTIHNHNIVDQGIIKAINTGEGFNSVGWKFAANIVFTRSRVLDFLENLPVERAKGIFIMENGVFAYNLSKGELTEIALESEQCSASCIEMIADHLPDQLETRLIACIAT